jgi:hypothetical protein
MSFSVSDDDASDDVDLGAVVRVDATRELDAVFDELEALLKNGDVVGALTTRGVNASLALVALDGLRAYLTGEKAQAADDLATVAEEIQARLASQGKPS